MVAQTDMVSGTVGTVSQLIPLCAGTTSPAQAPRHTSAVIKTDGLDDWSLGFSHRVQQFLLNSRKPSTCCSYDAKWSKYLSFLNTVLPPPAKSVLHTGFDFLLYLKDQGLRHSSLKVYLAAISSHQGLVEGYSVLSHSLSKQFIRGLRHLQPDTCLPPPEWDLPLVLQRLTRHPLKPMATCEFCLLSWKTVFLVAVTTGRRVLELGDLHNSPPYLFFPFNDIFYWVF